jgi:hypothetical protein
MRSSRRLFGAKSIAGLIAAGGSRFTDSSTVWANAAAQGR